MTSSPPTGCARRLTASATTGLLTALTLLLWAPQASADEELSATSTTSTVVPANATTALPGASVSGSSEHTPIQVTVDTNQGTLSVDPSTTVALAYGDHWAGDSSITVTGTRSELNDALATLAITTGADAGVPANVTVSALKAVPGYVYSPTNRHFYEFVEAEQIGGDDARTAALQRSFLGQSGYLATMATPAVNDLVASRIEGARDVWFGARAIDTPDADPARTWIWGDGPLAGRTVTACSNFLGKCLGVGDTSTYSGWGSAEPNNFDGVAGVAYSGEYAAQTNWEGASGEWNDVSPANVGEVAGYVVEYGDRAVGASDFVGLTTATSDVAVSAASGPAPGPSQPAKPRQEFVVDSNGVRHAKSITSKKVHVRKADELLVAFASVNGPSSRSQSLTGVTGGGLDWTLAARSNTSVGTSEVWQARTAGRSGSARTGARTTFTVTAKFARAGYSSKITVAGFTDSSTVVATGAAASGKRSAPTVSITPRADRSLIWAAGRVVGDRYDPRPGPGTRIVHDVGISGPRVGYWVQKASAPTTAGQPVTIADNVSTRYPWGLVAVEIRAAVPI